MRTEDARQAIEIMVRATGKPARRWKAVGQLFSFALVGDQTTGPKYQAHPGYAAKPGVSYDYSDPKTGLFGTCRRNKDGSWDLPPRGEAPVLLAYDWREGDR